MADKKINGLLSAYKGLKHIFSLYMPKQEEEFIKCL